MGKLKVTERDLRRVNRKPVRPRSQGITFFGVLGWLLAVGSGVALAYLLIHGHQQNQALKQSLQQRFASSKQELDATYATLAKKADTIVDDVKAIDARDKNEFTEARKLAKRDASLTEQIKRVNDELAVYQHQFDLARERLNFPYKTIGEMAADYKRLDAALQVAIEAENKRQALADAARRQRESRLEERKAEVSEEQDAPKPESKMFDLKMDTTKFRSKELVACSSTLKNGDFEHNYELQSIIIFYGVNTGNKHIFRVLKRLENTFTIAKRQELSVCNVELPLTWSFMFDGSYDFDGMVVVIKDTDGNIIAGRTMLTSQAKYIPAYANLKEGDHFDSSLRAVIVRKGSH